MQEYRWLIPCPSYDQLVAMHLSRCQCNVSFDGYMYILYHSNILSGTVFNQNDTHICAFGSSLAYSMAYRVVNTKRLYM